MDTEVPNNEGRDSLEFAPFLMSPFLVPHPAFLFCILHRVEIPHPAFLFCILHRVESPPPLSPSALFRHRAQKLGDTPRRRRVHIAACPRSRSNSAALPAAIAPASPVAPVKSPRSTGSP